MTRIIASSPFITIRERDFPMYRVDDLLDPTLEPVEFFAWVPPEMPIAIDVRTPEFIVSDLYICHNLGGVGLSF